MYVPKSSPLSVLKARTMAFAGAKGGVGKTSTACAVGQALAQRGYRVLLIDCDGQANSTDVFHYDMDKISTSHCTKRFFDGYPLDLPEIVIYDAYPGLDLIPSHLQLFREEQNVDFNLWAGNPDFPYGMILRKKLEYNVDDLKDYDVIIFDCNPYMGIINSCVLAVSDLIMMPVDDRDSLMGILTTIDMWCNSIEKILENMDADEVEEEAECLTRDKYRIILNRFEAQTKSGQHMIDILEGRTELMSDYENKLFGDFFNAFINQPIPERTMLNSLRMEKDIGRNRQGVVKSIRGKKLSFVMDEKNKDIKPYQDAINKIIDILIEKGDLPACQNQRTNH